MKPHPPSETLVHELRRAAELEDIEGIVRLLDSGVIALTDAGGDVISSMVSVSGFRAVARELIANLSLASGATVAVHDVNNAPALVIRHRDRVAAIVNLGVVDGRITHLWITRNPQKLQKWNSNRP